MNKRFFAFSMLMSACFLAHAKDIYVSVTGSDTNDGKTEQTALLTLQKAHDLVEPGDVVLVGNGTYLSDPKADKVGGSSMLLITKSGKPDAWITWKAQPGHKPVLRPRGWSGIDVRGSYHIIEGFTLLGANDEIVLLHALESAMKGEANPYFNTNGIIVEGRRNTPENKPHHVTIRKNIVGKFPGGGVTMIEADHWTVEDNWIFDNAWFMKYGGSGITTLNAWKMDDAPGYHIVIQRNKVWNNKTMVPWEKIGKLSDGNGILIDVTDHAKTGASNPNADPGAKPASASANDNASNPNADPGVKKPAASAGVPAKRVLGPNEVDPTRPPRPIWDVRSLIANNVSAFNGGSGIHTFRTAHVDIINNTVYWNGSNVGYQDLFPNRSEDITFLNNIIVPRPGAQFTSNNRNTKIRWDYNMYPVAQNVFKADNDIVADPQFVKVNRDLFLADFRLKSDSKGRDSGTDELAQPTDVDGAKRPQGAGRDRGAYEQ